ncbi:hypothetical protein VTI74DRAFT_8321 [Chaetomium olivicolor]
MAKFRLKMLPFSLLALVSLTVWGSSASTDSPSPSPSPSADVELICHTDNPAECYPKIFQATDEFQIVRDDQDLPQGLHVRLNVQTGQKEAKINVPDETDPALEGLPVDSSVVIVERDQAEAGPQPKARIPHDAPAYDPAGKIKVPKSENSDEGSAFYKTLTILKKGLDVDAALEMLEDISHDIYYGLKIAEDYDTVHELFCLCSAQPSDAANWAARARLAALTLASAVQNNPKALAELEAHWPKLSPSLCSSPNATPLGTSIFTLTTPAIVLNEDLSSVDAAVLKARISLLSGLLRSPLLRRHFLASSAISDLLRILLTTTNSPSISSSSSSQESEAGWHSAQRTAAYLLMDNFLDADMGAALGEWPDPAKHSNINSNNNNLASGKDKKKTAHWKECSSPENGVHEEECLLWHVIELGSKKYAKEEGHWSRELRVKLREAVKRDAQRRSGKTEL